MQNLKSLCMAFAIMFVLSLSSQANAAMVATSDQAGGYSNAVLDAVVKKWQPPMDGKESTTRIMVMIDGNGKVEDCSNLSNEKSDPNAAAACKAVKSIGKFSTPPYGLPMDVFLSFWIGKAETTPAVAPVAVTQAPAQNTMVTTPPKTTTTTKASTTTKAPVANSSYKPVIQENRSGAVLDDKDHYVKMVMRKIGPNVVFPPNLPQGELSTALAVQVDANGTIKSVKTSQSSGVKELDDALVKATQKTGKVNAPNDKKPRDLFLTFIIKNN